ncbi:ABC transporter permease [Labedaea rhizosphaerae]|uniref:Osmoprotectant transport system permease protein n=1 Tax=Labedaea rhizosphaerae TaxID=598644 RepID=A0A4R6S2J7_LABRH|nr:ABC transporter permease [Labedaea rhizosphaerae]TDP93781.1 osmoprotectant transport system permease protein [Labedaea rhizosphaerae]
MTWVSDHFGQLLQVSGQHLVLALLPVLIGFVLSVPLGWVAHRWRLARTILIPLSGLLYTIPSLALFVVMPALIGTRILDPLNVQVALTIYTIALLVRSVADALDAVPGHVVAAANAMGFGQLRRFFTVDLPLSVPVLTAGVRVAAVTNISLASIGAIIGVESLGSFLTEGFNRTNYPEIIAGIVAILVLALVVDALLLLVGKLITPWTRATRGASKGASA